MYNFFRVLSYELWNDTSAHVQFFRVLSYEYQNDASAHDWLKVALRACVNFRLVLIGLNSHHEWMIFNLSQYVFLIFKHVGKLFSDQILAERKPAQNPIRASQSTFGQWDAAKGTCVTCAERVCLLVGVPKNVHLILLASSTRPLV